MDSIKLEEQIQDKKDDIAFLESILPLLEQAPGYVSFAFPGSPSILMRSWDEYKTARRLFKGMLTRSGSNKASDGSTWAHFAFKESRRTISFNVDLALSDNPTCRRAQVGTIEQPVYEIVCDALPTEAQKETQ